MLILHYGLRGPRGSLIFAPIFLIAVPILLSVFAFGYDILRLTAVQAELQKAADAAALAGAQQLWQYSTQPLATTNSALAVAKMNRADGQPVAEPSARVDVNVVAPSTTSGGRVQVTVTKTIFNFFAITFGRAIETLSARATAGPAGMARSGAAGMIFPLAVSVDQSGPGGYNLLSQFPGSTFQLGWGQNMWWTGNNPGVRGAIANYMQPNQQRVPCPNPPVKVRSMIYIDHTYQIPNQQLLVPLVGDVITVPIVAGPVYSRALPVIGFVSLKIGSVSPGAPGAITATIVRGCINGMGDYAPSTIYPEWNKLLAQVEPQLIKLIQ